ncbi:DinB family protein [Paenibacillus sp. TRM 82003]|nr:DinB family protein [Paenibacillus sp. TRM 82003]
MYQTIDEFLADWKQEENLTLQVLDKLTDASLSQAVSEQQRRSLGDLGWHLTQSVGAFLGSCGLRFEGPNTQRSTPAEASDIAETYRSICAAAFHAMKEQWTDAKLAEKVVLFGFMDTTYSGMLTLLVRHQIHHRGQMTILMRQAGLVAPGLYGPNEEETAAMRAGRR